MEKLSTLERLNQWIRRSVTLKLVTIGFLILILLIPVGLLSNLITEREGTRNAAISEVSSKWGNQQTVGGPVISIPFLVRQKDEKGQIVVLKQYAHFLPENLEITGQLKPQQRNRGIYIVVLYNAQITLSGQFKAPDPAALNIAREDFLMNDAVLTIGISDMKGIKENITAKWNDTTLSFNPGIATADIFPSGISVPVRLDAQLFSFDCKIKIGLLPKFVKCDVRI